MPVTYPHDHKGYAPITERSRLLPWAEVEFNRLKGSHAWSPMAPVKHRKRANQHRADYTFEDGSMLRVWSKGWAAWYSGDPLTCRHLASGHHHCNKQGK